MEIGLAMYGCMMYALEFGNWEWLWSVVEKLGIVYGIIVCCLIYNLLPQQNKK